MRRVVTGSRPDGRSFVARDDELPELTSRSPIVSVWEADGALQLPSDGSPPRTMALRLRQPTGRQLAAVLERCRSDQLSYEPVGGSLDRTKTPPDVKERRWTTILDGPAAFERGMEAIQTWAVHRGAGLVVATDGPIMVGTNVALGAPLPIGFVDATCRIVVVVDEPNRYGFAYGTLSVHPERGEEAFVLTRRDDGIVLFDVHAVSSPAHVLARLVPPIAKLLQDRVARRYLSAMKSAVADTTRVRSVPPPDSQ